MPKPPGHRSATTPWPFWPLQLKTSSSHKEGATRNWLINTKEFVKDNHGKLIALKTVNVEWKMVLGERPQLVEISGTEKTWPCDLALLALGFTGPESTLADKLGIDTDARSNYKATYGKYQTNVANIFTAGDMRRGQSLIVWAISEGREAARQVDIYLMGKSALPSKDIAGDLVAM
jgi:glutamate synthase (NADPH/NADH) small chain